MKRVIASIAAVILCISFVGSGWSVGAFGMSDYPGADKLKEFGFIHGNDQGELLVEEVLFRSQACVLLAQLNGEYEKAQTFTGKSSFADVPDDKWYAPFVAYAEMRGWMVGYSNGKFGPEDPISVQMWAVLLLRVLGYEDNWATAVSDLSDIGVKIYASNPLEIKRGEAFDAMWAAVNKPTKGSSKSLGEQLGKLKPKNAEITKVVVPSLKYVDIHVNAALEKASAESIDHYKFYSDQVAEVSVEKAVYDASGNVIRVYFKEPLPADSRLGLERADVKMIGGGELLAEGFGEVKMADSVSPSLVKVESLGTKAIKVVFSEPVMSSPAKADFVFNKTIAIKSVHMNADRTEAIIHLNIPYRGALEVHPQRSIRDYYGHSLITDSVNIEMAAVTYPITVKEVLSASPIEVVFRLNRGVLDAVNKRELYSHGSGKLSDGLVEVEDDVVRIMFTQNYLPVGRSTVTVKAGAFTDYSGQLTKDMEFDVVVPEDNEMPYCEAVVLEKQNQVRLPYNEPMKTVGTQLLSKQNYVLLKEGEDVSKLISSVAYDSASYTVSVNTKQDLLGEYQIRVLEAKDLSGNDGASEYDFVMGDVMPPKPEKWTARIYNSGEANQMIVIRFDEPMSVEGEFSVLDPGKYMIGDKTFDSLNQTMLKMEKAGEGELIEIRYPGKKSGGMDFTSGKIHIARVADRSGNKVASIFSVIPLEKNAGMTIDEAGLISANELRLVIKDTVSDLDVEDIVVESAGKRVYGDVEFEAVEGISYIRMKFENNLTMPITVKSVKGNSVNQYGDPFVSSSRISVKDKIGPALDMYNDAENVYYDRNKRTIVLVFNERINEKVVSLLTFEVPGIEVEDITAADKEIRILVAASDKDKVAEEQLIVQKQEIRDMQGNSTEGIVTGVKYLKK